MRNWIRHGAVMFAVLGWCGGALAQPPPDLGYQGRLLDAAGEPLAGPVNLQVRIFDQPTQGAQLYAEDHPGVALADGVFDVLLGTGTNPVGTFDAELFAATNRWLEVLVNGEALAPRQPFSSVAYAFRAAVANSLDGLQAPDVVTEVTVGDGLVGGGLGGTVMVSIPAEGVTSALIADGATLDEIADDDGDGSGLDADLLDGLGSEAFWQLGGNAGTSAGTHFLGTTDDEPVEIHVHNQRAVRIERQNVIHGSPNNSIAEGQTGGTIAGGGYGQNLMDANTITGRDGTIGGGSGNTASGTFWPTVGGGHRNAASGNQATVGGGESNTASGLFSTVPGGSLNTASGVSSFAAGRSAKAIHNGTFVWADERFTSSEFTSVQPNEFAIRAQNGVRIANSGNGATLLRLETERPWEFRQRSSAQTTALELISLQSTGLSNKNFIINTDGRVGIGTTAPGFTLHVDGSAGKPGGGSWSNASDARLKDVGEPFTRGLEALEGIGPRHYRYAADNDLELPSEREYVGLIAQDVEAAIPEAIETNDTGYLHVNNDPILWTMLNGIKELNAKLEARLREKESRITELERRLAALEERLP